MMSEEHLKDLSVMGVKKTGKVFREKTMNRRYLFKYKLKPQI